MCDMGRIATKSWENVAEFYNSWRVASLSECPCFLLLLLLQKLIVIVISGICCWQCALLE